MRASLAVALVALTPATGLAQTEVTAVRWDVTSQDYGGLSGLEMSSDGKTFVTVSDDGVLFSGSFERAPEGNLRAVTTHSLVPLLTEDGMRSDEKRDRDMESVAIAPDGTRYTTAEGKHRILMYSKGNAVPRAIGLPKSPGVGQNTGFEAMGLDGEGRIVVLPESSRNIRTPYPIWRRENGGGWRQTGSLPRRGGFRPVGADFGPDGALYVLSRAFNGFAFASRVERSSKPQDPTSWQEVFSSDYGAYDNLEGLATWRDPQGLIRLVMVSDNNFNWYQVTQFVEATIKIPLP